VGFHLLGYDALLVFNAALAAMIKVIDQKSYIKLVFLVDLTTIC